MALRSSIAFNPFCLACRTVVVFISCLCAIVFACVPKNCFVTRCSDYKFAGVLNIFLCLCIICEYLVAALVCACVMLFYAVFCAGCFLSGNLYVIMTCSLNNGGGAVLKEWFFTFCAFICTGFYAVIIASCGLCSNRSSANIMSLLCNCCCRNEFMANCAEECVCCAFLFTSSGSTFCFLLFAVCTYLIYIAFGAKVSVFLMSNCRVRLIFPAVSAVSASNFCYFNLCAVSILYYFFSYICMTFKISLFITCFFSSENFCYFCKRNLSYFACFVYCVACFTYIISFFRACSGFTNLSKVMSCCGNCYVNFFSTVACAYLVTVFRTCCSLLGNYVFNYVVVCINSFFSVFCLCNCNRMSLVTENKVNVLAVYKS